MLDDDFLDSLTTQLREKLVTLKLFSEFNLILQWATIIKKQIFKLFFIVSYKSLRKKELTLYNYDIIIFEVTVMKYKTVKARKQGTSMTLTIPAQFKVCENALFEPKLLDNGTIQYSPIVSDADIEHDRKMIEQSFKYDQLLTEEDMEKRFGKYGWGQDED